MSYPLNLNTSIGQSGVSATPGKIQKRPVPGIHHIFMIDWDDNGIEEEIAVVQERSDGSIYGIPVKNLHPIDRKRLRTYITSVHADKYELWDLLSQGRLNNGMVALDFFHANYVKVKRPKGAIMGGSWSQLSTSITDTTADRFVSGDTGQIGQQAPAQVHQDRV